VDRVDLVLVGDGRLARHLTHYFQLLGIAHRTWSRKMHAGGRAPALEAMVHADTRVLLAISDDAIEPFIASHTELHSAVRIHFSGRLVTSRAIGAHPLFSFATTLYDRDLYERIPFVIDAGAPPVASLIPGLPNPAFFVAPDDRPRYHALCVLAGNFTTLLWRKFFFELESRFGIPRQHALPYLESVARGLAGAGAPLTGPLSRGDRGTIDNNIEALAGDPFEGVYRAFLDAYERQQQLAARNPNRNWLKDNRQPTTDN
jgi:predicted short-subunit dehydrogenase-like oxidoreductase (DUF2520 family)